MQRLSGQLRVLREDYGLTVEATAALAGMDAGRLSAIESGAAMSTAELGRLADAFAVDPALIHAGRAEDARRTVARFRAPQGITDLAPEDRRLLARASELGRLGASLRQLLGQVPSPLAATRRPCAPSAYPEPWEQGYELGRSARDRISPNRVPIESVQHELEKLGVHVAIVRFQRTEIEAASLYEPGSMPIVLVNGANSRSGYPLSRRAILSHEFCHLLHDGGERDVTVVSREASTDPSPVEKRANGFAPNFLVPREWLNPACEDPIDRAIEIATTWGLSFEGAVWHAKNARLLSDDVAEELQRLPRKPLITATFEPEIRRTPPAMFDLDVQPSELTAGYLVELAIAAYADGSISKARAEEIIVSR